MTRYIWDTEEGTFIPASEYVAPEVKRSDFPMPELMASFESYQAPITEGNDLHPMVRTRKQQSDLMKANDAIDSRDVPHSMRNENVRKARGQLQ